jgi:predicted DNA-binding transcriptional regulator AlpA
MTNDVAVAPDSKDSTTHPPSEAYRLLLSAKDAASACGLSSQTWWRLHSSGKTPMPIKLGGSTRWKADELRAWVDAGCPDRATWEASKNNP